MYKKNSQRKLSILSPCLIFYPDIPDNTYICIYLFIYISILGFKQIVVNLQYINQSYNNDLLSSNSLQRAEVGALKNIILIRPLLPLEE